MRLALLFPAILMIAGCDDPDVQDKIVVALQHGSVAAHLECYHYSHPAPLGSYNYIHYKADKLADGACLATVSGSFLQNSTDVPNEQNSITQFSERTSTTSVTCEVLRAEEFVTHSSYPYRRGTDGSFVAVDSGYLVAGFRDGAFVTQSCSGVACPDPRPWFSYDITGPDCTGFNLQAFGAP